MIEVPDISHLTPEEQQKILSVLKRQQDEEDKEKNMLKVLHDQFEDYKSHIKMVAEESKAATPPDDNDPVCALCYKTKFAEGCGHICTFCEIRFCSRCGGRITIKSNKTMWVCNLCRKQKEILTKSGAWYHTADNNNKPFTTPQINHQEDTSEKENRQTEAAKTPITPTERNANMKKTAVESFTNNGERPRNQSSISPLTPSAKGENSKENILSPVGQVGNTVNKNVNITQNLPVDDTRIKKVETVPNFNTYNDHKNTSSPSLGITQSVSIANGFLNSHPVKMDVPQAPVPAKRTDVRQTNHQQKRTSKTSPEHEKKALSERELNVSSPVTSKSRLYTKNGQVSHVGRDSRISQSSSKASISPSDSYHRISQTLERNRLSSSDLSQKREHAKIQRRIANELKHNSYTNIPDDTKPSYISSRRQQLNGCRSEPNLPECYSVPDKTREPGVHRKRLYRLQPSRKGPPVREFSISSSEDDIRSGTEYSSIDDADKETSSDYEFTHLQHPSTMNQMLPHACYHRPCYHPLENYAMENFTKSSTSLYSCRRSSGNTRDSGVESSSVLCHDLSQEQLPVPWQPSSDGRFLIGHLLLYKNVSSASNMARRAGALLGLKVVGGKTTPSGRLGAFVTKVKKGSLADTIGHLKPGDEIISWNKFCLQDATFDEVYEIILESKADSMVELVVSRPIRDVPRIPETRLHQTAESSSCSLDSERRDFESYTIKPLHGRIQIKIWYDEKSQQLYVTAIRAVDLLAREGGLPRNPYLKMYLLPDRSNLFKRKTKTAKKTLAPEWMQTFVYGEVRRDDLGAMALELTLWDYDRSLEANNKFMGEVIIDLGLVCLNDEPHWFYLMPLGCGMNQDYASESYPLMPTSSVSSDVNFTEASNDTLSKSTSYIGTTQSSLARTQKSPKAMHKRMLPHLPVTTSQNTIAYDETKSVGRSTPATTVKESRRQPQQPQQQREDISDIGDGSVSSKPSMNFEAMSVDHSQTLQTFVGGVGPGQIVGRQALGMSSVGELELGFYRHQSQLVVQVKRARNLSGKSGSRTMPAFYVKVYMMSGVQCITKKKTKLSTRTLSPNFNESLVFDPNHVGNALQVIIWGDYGRMDNKSFTGSAQIALENLDLATRVIGWYKLFPSSSIIDASSYGPRQDSYSSFGSSSQILT
uniref:regulating synaptic membrane exocytosis protein 2-like isoform X3 n=1 Tax=Styela clava TaxID=7725 RepID=UPI00193A1408|nr:regulating synaptic membrane exocytosis protein 2-like isoform X3 [Styela clava]